MVVRSTGYYAECRNGTGKHHSESAGKQTATAPIDEVDTPHPLDDVIESRVRNPEEMQKVYQDWEVQRWIQKYDIDEGSAESDEEPEPDLTLCNPKIDLIAAIRADLAAVGLVGESSKALLVYLGYSSRKRKKPLNFSIKGSSSSGKNQIQHKPALLMPPEDVINATSLTPNALYYGPQGWLRNKIVLGGERSHDNTPEGRDRTASIRQMLSEGVIDKLTVIKLETVHIRQEGPISYSETTTQHFDFEEDRNRCFLLYTDESQEQTRNILLESAKRYLPQNGAWEERCEEAKLRHHEFQRCLENVEVGIPYADQLALMVPVDNLVVRRTFNQVLSLIEVIAYVQQFQRQRTEQGQILATVADYALARSLVLESFESIVGLGNELAACHEIEQKLPAKPFTTTEAMAALEKDSHKTTLDALKRLESVGVLKCIQKGAGSRPAQWVWTGFRSRELILPLPTRLTQ